MFESEYKFRELQEKFLEHLCDKCMELDEKFDKSKNRKEKAAISLECCFLLDLRRINMN